MININNNNFILFPQRKNIYKLTRLDIALILQILFLNYFFLSALTMTYTLSIM